MSESSAKHNTNLIWIGIEVKRPALKSRMVYHYQTNYLISMLQSVTVFDSIFCIWYAEISF